METDKEFVERMKWHTDALFDPDLARLVALALRGAETQWRPIEEAPRSNGSVPFLAHITGHGGHVCHRLTDTVYSHSTGRQIHRATHFIPLSALGEPGSQTFPQTQNEDQ